MANIGFISLGCAKNQVDCERMMYRVQEAGHTVKADIVGSDVVVINTCGFIDSAKSEAIDYILQTAAMKAEGLVGKILVTGCLSQRYQEDILNELPEVDGILGTGSYTKIVPAIEQLLSSDDVIADFGSIDQPEEETGRVLTTPEHYAYLKIAEGCGYPNVVSVDTMEALDEALAAAKSRDELSFIEVKSAIGARADLGRPTTTARENKEHFMEELAK